MSYIADYSNKRVIVSGGGGAGMGAALVEGLCELGAEVHVLDLKDSSEAVKSHQAVNLLDPDAIDQAVARIGGPVHSLFNCAGLPGPPHSGLDTVLVNFVAARHLTGAVVTLMGPGASVATIGSAGGIGWEHMLDVGKELIDTAGFDQARTWLEERTDLVGEGYLFSKQMIMIWTMHCALDLAQRGIRVNCTSPGPTDTPMMPAFEQYMGKDFMDSFPVPMGRRSTPQDQVGILLFLNSDAASYITGTNVYVDGGFWAGLTTGRLAL